MTAPDAVTMLARSAPLPPPELRGRTEIADRAIVGIACRAALEVPEVRDVQPHGPLHGRPWAPSPRGTARGGRSPVRLDVSMAYPTPVHAVSVRLREHVMRRVAAQTGLTLTRLDITLTELGGDLP